MHHALRLPKRLVVAASALALTAGVVAIVAMGASAQGSRHGHKLGNEHFKTLHGSGGLSITSSDFGSVPANPPSNTPHEATLFTLSNGHKMTVKITNYGGVVQSIWVPDRRGRVANVALGFAKLVRLHNGLHESAGGRIRRYLLRRDHRPLREPDRRR